MLKRKSALYAAMFSLALPLAAHAEVLVYGQAHLSVDIEDNGATSPNDGSSLVVSSNASRIGFSGSEDIAHNLKGVWQYESEIRVDSATGTWAQRNSFLGVEGSFGRVIVGNHDTPYKKASKDIFDDSRADYNAVIGNTGGALANRKPFDNRQPNVIIYNSPNFNGLQFGVGYGADEDHDATDNDVMSLGATYTTGPLYLGLGYESQEGAGAGTPADDATGLKVAATYALTPKASIGAIIETIDLGSTRGGRDAFYLSAAVGLGDNTFKAAVANIDAWDGSAATNADTGATHFAIGLYHPMGKNTEVYGLYTATDNENAGTYGLSTVDAAAAGQDVSALSVGMIHKFSSK